MKDRMEKGREGKEKGLKEGGIKRGRGGKVV